MVEVEVLIWKRINEWAYYAPSSVGVFHKTWSFNYHGTKKQYFIRSPNGAEYAAGRTSHQAETMASEMFYAMLKE